MNAIRTLAALAACLAVGLAPSWAATDLPALKTPQDATKPAVKPIDVVAAPGFDAARGSQGTGLYQVSTIRRSNGNLLTVYGLMHNGQLLDVQGKQGSGWAAKQAGSSSPRSFSTGQFDQLMAFQGRDMRQASPEDKARFTQITGLVLSGAAAPTGTPAVPKTNCKPSDPQCGKPISSNGSWPLTWLASAVWSVVPSAQAALQFFEINILGVRYTYDEAQGYAGFNGFGITAIWAL